MSSLRIIAMYKNTVIELQNRLKDCRINLFKETGVMQELAPDAKVDQKTGAHEEVPLHGLCQK